MSTSRVIARSLSALMAALAVAQAASAQTPQAAPPPAAVDTQSSQSKLQSEAGEPRAATGEAASSSPAAGESEAARPLAGPPHGGEPARAERREAAGGKGGKVATDRLELGTATVTGDREQPKVMYIVPWKKSDIGDLSGKPMNSLLDEALAPIDRDEFKRQVVYYQAVKADASQNGAKPPALKGEK